MSEERSPNLAQQLYGDIAPKLAACTDEILFGDIWKRPQLSPRDRISPAQFTMASRRRN
jgi:4-carboxymuconolactone decarboxylase